MRPIDLPENLCEPPGLMPVYSSSTPIRSEQTERNFESRSKIKPQNYDGSEDFDEYLTQFKLIAELNGWSYRTKSLYLASCLVGNARTSLNELSEEKRKHFKNIVRALENRFGSVNRAEVFRSKLQSRVKTKDETIPELAQSIRKLTRKAYPTASSDTINVLALDYFIDALPDSDIRLRLREVGPKTIMEAESIAVRLDAHRIADKSRGRQSLKLIDTVTNRNEVTEKMMLDQMCNVLNELTNEVKGLHNQRNQIPTGQGENAQNGNSNRQGQFHQNQNKRKFYKKNQGYQNQNRTNSNNQNNGQGFRHQNEKKQENNQRSNLGTASRQN